MERAKNPVLCIVAGPNGAGKTSTTQQLLQNNIDTPIACHVQERIRYY